MGGMKTFAERLEDHNRFCDEVMSKIRKALDVAKRTRGETKTHYLDQADKLIAIIDAATIIFESKYKKELKVLQSLT